MALSKVKTLLDMIKFEHTVFALPFAYLGMVLGARGLPTVSAFFWITCAMVGARSYAMGLNRLFDRHIDKKNPRTAGWALPSGRVRMGEAVALVLISLALFCTAVFMLPPLCRSLWPVVIVPMTFYSLMKRVTWLCHFVLGLCLGLAPLGSWVGTTGELPPAGIAVLGLGVLCWTAGFDILYSCQDYGFDKEQGLHSVPVRFGIQKALLFTKALHAATVALFAVAGASFSLGPFFYAGIAAAACFLWYENHIVRPGDLSRINISFFTVNGFVSIFIFIFTFISVVFCL